MNKRNQNGFLRRLVFGTENTLREPGQRTLVVVFLRGGADTLNMLVPYGDDDYYRLRPTLSIDAPKGTETEERAIRLDDFYGIHPRMHGLVDAYEGGRLGMVQAVGSDDQSGSHFEAQDQMEHGESYGRRVGGGWLGRYLRTRAGETLSALSAVAIGTSIPESLRGAPAASAMTTLDEVQIQSPSGQADKVSAALHALYGAEVGVLGTRGEETLDLLTRVEALRGKSYTPEGGAVYPNEPFGAGLREIARLVKARVGLEVACVDLGGWDTHFVQGSDSGLQADKIGALAEGLAAFDKDLAGYQDRVTTIVMTEFGRRIYENGSYGTDHGRGFALMAMGNGVQGGQILGKWPGLDEEEDAPGPGGMRIEHDYRSVLSEVLVDVMGCADLSRVFPDFKPKGVGLIG